MKWVRMVGQGVPVRLTDAKAREIIAEGDGEFCSNTTAREWWNACGDPDFKRVNFAAFDRNRKEAGR